MSVRARRLSACAVLGLTFLLASCSNSTPVAPASPPMVAVHNHSGMYTLTVTASGTAGPCASTFPPVAKRRVYTARLQQRFVSGRPYLEVFLSGADFISGAFSGNVLPTGEIHFRIYDAWPGDAWNLPANANVVERLSDGTQLVVVADINARRTGSTIVGQGGVLTHSTGGQCAIESFEMVLSGDPGVGYWDY